MPGLFPLSRFTLLCAALLAFAGVTQAHPYH